MSVCTCPKPSRDEWEQLFRSCPTDDDWCLLSIKEMYLNGNSLQMIEESVPFRNRECARSHRCCGMCTRQCYNRCVQDSLHRIYQWRQLVNNTPKERLHEIPLSIRLIVKQKFESAADLSWAVGDVIASSKNPKVRQYMRDNHLQHTENPYKADYSPTYAIDASTGKRVVNYETGELKVVEWPDSGLCPYCEVSVTIDRRYCK